MTTASAPAPSKRAHDLWWDLCLHMDASGLSRTYPRAEYIRDGEWEELASTRYGCVVVHDRDIDPERVTIDGRAWTADIRFGDDWVTLDVTGKMTIAGGVVMGAFLGEVTDRTPLMKDQVEAHRN